MKNDAVLIGDYLGTIEEFVPGEGTYAEDGKIYASNIGIKVVDVENHIVKVVGKALPLIKKGQIVFGEVLDIKKNAVVVIVRKILKHKGDVDIKTGLFVSNIADEYVEKPEDMYAIGDIVKGVVIRIDAGLVDISTKGSYGVVKAFCRRCRCPLTRQAKNSPVLVCPCCGNKEKRKVAADYGNVADL